MVIYSEEEGNEEYQKRFKDFNQRLMKMRPHYTVSKSMVLVVVIISSIILILLYLI